VRAPISKVDARKRLLIPVEGTYVGQIGKSDQRKAIPEMLAAFRAAQLGPEQRLVLAGSLHPPYKTLIDARYADLLMQGRLILIDRYLRPDELHAANCAMDVVAVACYTDELSGSLLAALAAERPVLAGHRGYTGMIIEKFDVGYAADIKNHAALTSTIQAAVRASAAFQFPSKARRLLRFHDPQNFADTLLRQLYARLDIPSPDLKTWDWALQGEGAAPPKTGRPQSVQKRSERHRSDALRRD
jgi:glycosyltransferase involved in cell wall biosynthesis